MNAPGTYKWAIEQLQAGNPVRRASWPFYWIFSPLGSNEEVEFHVRQDSMFHGAPLIGIRENDQQVGSGLSWALPFNPDPDKIVSLAVLQWVLAEDWVIAVDTPEIRGIGKRLEPGDSLLLISQTHRQDLHTLKGEPEQLAGFRKVTLFVPVS